MLTTASLSEIKGFLADRLETGEAARVQYGRGESWPTAMPPDAVAFPESTEEVARLVRICAASRTPVIASGACTSLEGQITAPMGGLAINLARMKRVLAIHPDDLDCLVEAGVTREQLNHELRHSGLFFPIDPGANATLGGMAATRASGTNAVRYGTMATNVLGLTVVKADGTVIRTGGRSRKSASGYDLTRLYVGSEGTLGIITEVRLRLYGVPEEIAAASCMFDDVAGAVHTVSQLIQLGVPVARVELLDEVQVAACNLYSHLDLPERPHLFLEFHGSPAATAEQAQISSALAADNGGHFFSWVTTTEARNRLWKARHNALFAAAALRPGAEVWSSDVCVPIAAMPDAVLAVRRDIDAAGLIAPIVGHVGDGNFHVLFVLAPDDAEERRNAENVYARMIDRALAAGGTCTGEHGIGLRKRSHLITEHGAEAVATMRALKKALDPDGIMNPGKIF